MEAKMQVTGWTYWENPQYIDINRENMELRGRAMRSVTTRIPRREELEKYSEEEIVIILSQREKEMDIALDADEIHMSNELEEEIYKTVINDVRENGYHFSGDVHQSSEFGCPVIDDKYILCVSMRTWGDIMANAYPEEVDDSKGYGYCKWAWSNPDLSNECKYPDESLIIR